MTKPVLKPDGTYCSSWCGFGCTKAEYDRCVASADELASRLGDGWKPRVWENLGWHYSVMKGVAQVYAHYDHVNYMTRYTAYINNDQKQFIAASDDPQDALGFATQDARTFINTLTAELEEISR